MNVAIVGMGPFGLCVLETLLRYLRNDAFRETLASTPVRIHVIEPAQAGCGVHKQELPDYLLLNTVCGQLDLFGSRYFPEGASASSLGFMDWVQRQGYTIDAAGRLNESAEGRPVESGDFLPRRIFGRYLTWVYDALTHTPIPGVQIERHAAEATSIKSVHGREEIALAGGGKIHVDHVFITIGHAPNLKPRTMAGFMPPYPVENNLASIAPGAAVAVAGMGLVAVDVVTALTTGRGGHFVPGERTHSLRYVASGEEPKIYLYSRNGLPFFCRPSATLDTTGAYHPMLFTDDAIRSMRMRYNGKLDFRADLLPLLFAEMTILFYCRHVELADGVGTIDIAKALAGTWQTERWQDTLAPYRERFGAFDPEELLLGPHTHSYASAEDYRKSFCGLLQRDIEESVKGESRSPLKAAVELLRVLRETLRLAIEFDGLTPASKDDFQETMASMITRVVVGPPLQRGMELMALIEAGVVDAPFGPSPQVSLDEEKGDWLITSTSLQQPVSRRVNNIVAGYLDAPTVDRSQSPLLASLLESGRIRPSKHSIRGAGIDVDRHGCPFNKHDTIESAITVLGPLTEGSRYFTHYVPSPKSRFRAFLDADLAVDAFFTRHQALPHMAETS